MNQSGVGELRLKIQLPRRHRLRWQLVGYFIALATLPLIITMSWTLERLRQHNQQQIINQLNSIADLKAAQISNWLKSELNFLSSLQADNQRRKQLTDFLVAGPSSPTELAELSAFLRDFEQIHTASELLAEEATTENLVEHSIVLYDVHGRILAAANPADIGKSLVNQPYFAASMSNPAIHPPYYSIANSQLTLTLTYPLRDRKDQVVGALAMRILPYELGQIMRTRSGMGESGETYLVSADTNYMITPSRFAGYPMNQAYHSQGIDRGLAGESGASSYGDYRDPPVPVIGVYRWLPQLNAVLLAEIDLAEAQQSFDRAMALSLMLTLLMASIAILLGVWVATRLARPIVQLTQAATQIAAGSLDSPIVAGQRSEIGLLSSAFRQMAERLHATLAGLEQRVAERTAELERSNRTTAQALAELRESVEQRELLNATVRELSSPALPIMEGVLLMPLIGALDIERAGLLTEALLQGIERHSSRVAILDVTGVPIVDTQVAKVLLQASQAARLLGARPVLVGIRPELAQTIVGLGIDLADLTTCADLQAGLRYAAALTERR